MSEGVDLSGKAVVVTGGGRGLGAAVARAVAAAGAAVVVTMWTRSRPMNARARSARPAGEPWSMSPTSPSGPRRRG